MKIGIFIKNYAVGTRFDKSGVPNKSGAEFHAENHAKLLIEDGNSVYVMTKKNRLETKGRERIDNIDVVRLHDPFRWLECAIRLFSSHSNTDCIYILGTPKFSVWTILIAKYIQHIPTTLVLTSKVEIFDSSKGWRNKIFGQCDQYIAISQEIAQGLQEKVGIEKGKIHVLPQGVDTVNRFYPVNSDKKRKLRETYKLPEGCPIILFCARIVPNKGIKVMLQAWKIVHKQVPEAKLLVVGGGLKELVSEIKIAGKQEDNSIIVTGEVDKTDDYYKMSDLYFFPSEFEGLSTTLMEAISSGLPCVASKIGGNEDLVLPSKSGVLVDKFDYQTFAKEIIRLLRDPKQRAICGESGRAYATSHLDCHKLLKTLENILSNKTAKDL